MKRALAAMFAAVVLAGPVFRAGPAFAVLPSEQLADPRLEARARAIGSQLRCLVCQNQTIDDSDAALAGDLRVILRERLLAGDTDKQAMDFIVKRYGDFVLLNPPFKAQTLALWLGPPFVLLAGGIWVALLARRKAALLQPSPSATPPLTPDERERLLRRLDAESAK